MAVATQKFVSEVASDALQYVYSLIIVSEFVIFCLLFVGASPNLAIVHVGVLG